MPGQCGCLPSVTGAKKEVPHDVAALAVIANRDPRRRPRESLPTDRAVVGKEVGPHDDPEDTDPGHEDGDAHGDAERRRPLAVLAAPEDEPARPGEAQCHDGHAASHVPRVDAYFGSHRLPAEPGS